MIPAKSTIFPLFATIISRRHVFLAVEKQCDNRLSIFCFNEIKSIEMLNYLDLLNIY